ncbi:MAG: MMPL family transporter [bacterium]|nr:MMPL family transporter [bacterium]
MKPLAEYVVEKRIYILVIFLLLAVISILIMPHRKLSYSIFDILPSNIKSLTGIRILSEKIAKGPEFTILCERDNIEEIELLVKKLESLPYVISVSWLGNNQDLAYPDELWNSNSNSWYKEGFYKIGITLRSSNSYKEQIREIKELLPSWAGLTGSEVISYDMEDYFKNSTLVYFSLGILFVVIFLFLTFPSALVPVLMVFSMIVGVLINLAFTAISGKSLYFLMDTIVAILQVAVTLDYALFLYHRYEEERSNRDKESAMVSAILSTFKPISLSSLTTIAGFFALTFGRLTLYSIMGWILVRGVFISLIVVLTLFPSLLLLFDRFISGKRHRIIPLGVGNLGKFTGRYSYLFTIVFVVLLVTSLYSNSKTEPVFDINIFLPKDIPSVAVMNKSNEIFGRTESAFIVAREDAQGLTDALTSIKSLDGVKAVMHYSTVLDPALPEELIPKSLINRFTNNGYTFASVSLGYRLGDEKGKRLKESMARIIEQKVKGEAYLTGESVLLTDIRDISFKDQRITTRLSLVLIVLIIALGFLSFSVPLTLTLVIQLAIWLNIGYYYLFNTPMPFFIPSILGTIQLGATIDYAVLLTSRYQEERRKGNSPIESVNRSVYWGAHSIITSAGTMILMNLPASIFSNIKLIRLTMGSLARGGLLSLIIVLFFLPALLVILDKVFRFTSYKWSDDKDEKS